MDAFTCGSREGKEYLSRFPIEKMPYDGYIVMGRVTSKQRYKQEKAQQQYRAGWLFIGERFHSLFKLEDTNIATALAKINGINGMIERDRQDIEKFLSWREDDPQVQDYLQGAYRSIQDTQDYLNDLLGVLKEREQ